MAPMTNDSRIRREQLSTQRKHFSRTLLLLLLLFSVVSQGGCASTIVKPDRLDEINRVAIVGFQGINSLRDPDRSSRKGLVGAINITAEIARDASGKEDRDVRKALNRSYDLLVETLNGRTGFTALSRRDVSHNAWYRGELSRRGETPGFDLTTADGIIGTPLLESDTQEDRERFMDKMGVTAIAMARINWVTGSAQEAGFAGYLPGGKRLRPAANVEFWLWERGFAEPVWREKGIRGCPALTGIEDAGGIHVISELGPSFSEATTKGFDALMDRYEQALSSEGGSVGVSLRSLMGSAKCQ